MLRVLCFSLRLYTCRSSKTTTHTQSYSYNEILYEQCHNWRAATAKAAATTAEAWMHKHTFHLNESVFFALHTPLISPLQFGLSLSSPEVCGTTDTRFPLSLHESTANSHLHSIFYITPLAGATLRIRNACVVWILCVWVYVNVCE